MKSTFALAVALILMAPSAMTQTMSDHQRDIGKIDGLRLSLESYVTDGAATVQAAIQNNLEGEEVCAREVETQATTASDSLYTAEAVLGIAWLMRDPEDAARARVVSRSTVNGSITALDLARGRLRDLDPTCAPYPVAVAKMRSLAALVDDARVELTAVQERMS